MSGLVLSLCDRTGNIVRPWLDAGYDALTVDLQECVNPHPNRLHLVRDVTDIMGDLSEARNVVAVFAFPPCTHLAVSGARHFKSKGLEKVIEALRVVSACRRQCEEFYGRVPWFIENPVSTLSTYWRKPDYIFNPHDFTGFELGDNYTKKTCLWTGGGFVMPEPNRATDLPAPDDRIHKAPPSDERADFRSETPMGFARALFQANAPHLKRIAA